VYSKGELTMTYDLQQCSNTGNWWIMRQDETGYREIVRTLSADLSYKDALIYLKAYILVIEEANQEIKNG
jgi:hypothetical protein|tara:strand:+ start:97 stop:306 length:210 start_codon:yes stop_codon:yes gene_type:complete